MESLKEIVPEIQDLSPLANQDWFSSEPVQEAQGFRQLVVTIAMTHLSKNL
jgi:hypothetical protein